MSEVYTKMRDQFEKWSQDAQKVLDNEVLLFPDTTSYQDDVMELLYIETDLLYKNFFSCYFRVSR